MTEDLLRQSSGQAFNLQRFVDAQANGVYEQALSEIRSGEKRSHWMWFIFPQSAELGRSPTAKFYGLSGEDEARAYLAHPVLGPRYRECLAAVRAWVDIAARCSPTVRKDRPVPPCSRCDTYKAKKPKSNFTF